MTRTTRIPADGVRMTDPISTTLPAVRILAIGGGNLRLGETRRIDERIVELAGVCRPRVLLIPTASDDRPDYIGAFR